MRTLAVLLFATLLAAPVAAQDAVTVRDAWARASAGATATGAAYVTLAGGATADALTGASTPVAATAEVHESSMQGGVMRMRAVPSIPVPAGRAVTLAPGGLHIMLMGLKRPLAAGDSFPLTLTFERAPPVTVDVPVRAIGGAAAGGAPMGGHEHMQMK
jgi:hypothetical protein